MGDILKMTTKDKPDFTGNPTAALMLVDKIRKYWTLRGKDYKVWLEKEKYGEDQYIYNIRSNIKVSW